jgi:hypothetical protein
MLELGFQSPPEHAAVPFEASPSSGRSPALIASSLAWRGPPGATPGGWAAAFPARSAWRHLDARYCVLAESQALAIGARDFERAIVIASGEVELGDPVRRRLSAFGAIHLDAGRPLALRATVAPALLLAVEARGGAGRREP